MVRTIAVQNTTPPGFQKPQSTLVPIPGTNLRITPGDPVSPFDCELYPDSPYCGGNPLTRDLAKISPKPVLDKCNFGVELETSLLFYKGPRFQIVRRDPSCRYDPPPPPPPLPPRPGQTSHSPDRKNCGNGYFELRTEGFERDGVFRSYGFIEALEVSNQFSYELSAERNADDPEDADITIGEGAWSVRRLPVPINEVHQTGALYWVSSEGENLIASKHVVTVEIITGPWLLYYHSDEADPLEPQGYWFTSYPWIYERLKDAKWPPCPGFSAPPPPLIPSPNPPECCDMPCCHPSPSSDPKIRQILADLEEIKKRIGTFPQELPVFDGDLSKRGRQAGKKNVASIAEATKALAEIDSTTHELLGADEFPASVPNSIISKKGITIDNTELTNVPQILEWFFKRVDEIAGEWEAILGSDDINPTKEGDQSIEMRFPNISEAILEMIGLLLECSVNTNTLVNMCTRTLAESGQAKQLGIITEAQLKAIIDYLGFNHEEKAESLSFAFTPGKENLDETLKESKIEIPLIKFKDKIGLRDSILDLSHAAAIIRAVYWRKLDPKGDLKQQIANQLRTQDENTKKIHNEEGESNNFDRYCEDVEIGFTNKAGISDPLKPWGKDYENRPRIKKLGNTSDSGN